MSDELKFGIILIAAILALVGSISIAVATMVTFGQVVGPWVLTALSFGAAYALFQIVRRNKE